MIQPRHFCSFQIQKKTQLHLFQVFFNTHSQILFKTLMFIVIANTVVILKFSSFFVYLKFFETQVRLFDNIQKIAEVVAQVSEKNRN